MLEKMVVFLLRRMGIGRARSVLTAFITIPEARRKTIVSRMAAERGVSESNMDGILFEYSAQMVEEALSAAGF